MATPRLADFLKDTQHSSSSKRDDDPEKPQPKRAKKDRSHIECFSCRKLGHRASECPEKKQQETTQSILVGQALLMPHIETMIAQLRAEIKIILNRITALEDANKLTSQTCNSLMAWARAKEAAEDKNETEVMQLDTDTSNPPKGAGVQNPVKKEEDGTGEGEGGWPSRAES
ncbi:hypothetical protein EDB81DRAFT_883252 [Dactylonectria macrodidyma]|uniref:CCHC-type domain-containing protein n=1 Tax=Dactylonectria macrodidyma TaxID=307937 RepID=A0A9P9EZJ6_9HYPO|nr:hypothetical protein EDB81DRAFT_883252 [Dactylonectria macrodidyma]